MTHPAPCPCAVSVGGLIVTIRRQLTLQILRTASFIDWPDDAETMTPRRGVRFVRALTVDRQEALLERRRGYSHRVVTSFRRSRPRWRASPNGINLWSSVELSRPTNGPQRTGFIAKRVWSVAGGLSSRRGRSRASRKSEQGNRDVWPARLVVREPHRAHSFVRTGTRVKVSEGQAHASAVVGPLRRIAVHCSGVQRQRKLRPTLNTTVALRRVFSAPGRRCA